MNTKSREVEQRILAVLFSNVIHTLRVRVGETMKLAYLPHFIVSAMILVISPLKAEEDNSKQAPPPIVTFGEMHLAIGQQQHQGRIELQKLVERSHFNGVGALAGLKGEITIRDGEILISSVAKRKPTPINPESKTSRATLLAGAYVSEWSHHEVVSDIPPVNFDEYIRKTAAQHHFDTKQPFVFRIDGEFQNVRLHVINGACPVHSRIHNKILPTDKQPYEAEFGRIRGTAIGIYAQDAVGKLTHPSTSTHVHLIFKDEASGEEFTGHLERVGVVKEAVLKLPKQ